MRNTTLYVCSTCKRDGDDADGPRAGAQLHAAILNRPVDGFAIEAVECLGNCKRACTIAVVTPGAWTYVFGDLDPVENAADAILAAKLMAETGDAVMPWRPRSDILKRSMIARIPPTPLSKAAE